MITIIGQKHYKMNISAKLTKSIVY